MGIGTSLFLIAVGAILYFAVDATISGLEITTIGLILMIVGVIGLLISLFFLSSARRGRPSARSCATASRGRTSARPHENSACPFVQARFDAGLRAGGG